MRRPPRWLTWLPLVIAVCIIMADMVVTRVLHGVVASSRRIAKHEIPSQRHLNRARQHYFTIAISTVASFTPDRFGQPLDRSWLEPQVAALRLALDEYELESGDHGPLLAELRANMDQVATEVHRTLDLVERGDHQAAALARSRVGARCDRAGALLSELLYDHQLRLEILGDEVTRAHRDALIAVWAGHGSIALGAIMMMLLTRRLLRGYTQLAEERMRLLSERAKELELFAGRVAHDLRGPLSTMSLRIALAKRKNEPLALDAMSRQLDTMDRMIGGLLEFARAGAHPEPGASANVSEVIDEALASVRDKAAVIDAELEVEGLDPLRRARVACSPGVLQSVISNLLENALKYMDTTQVPRRVTVRVNTSKNVHVEVEDTGPGIPESKQKCIFEPFVRASNASGGIGLGLATVKKAVESFGGVVGVRSKPGHGACFWFELPEAPPRSSRPSAA